MKKVYSLLALAVFATGSAFAQCTINPSAQTTPGVNPTADQLPCVIVGQPYDQTLQGKIQDSHDTTLVIAGFSINAHIQVDSIRLDSIAGLPAGITWSKNPNVLLGGGNGCVQFTGTSNAAPGNYPLEAFGTVWMRIQVQQPIQIDTPYTYNGSMNRFSPFGDYYLDVINSGAVCHATGINDFNADLNAALSVFPNPNNGMFNVVLNSGSRVNGTLAVVDMTGRVVFNQALDVIGLHNTAVDLTNLPKGLYTLQLKTAEGFASKNISVQ
ncbi:MAG: T9SS type A sorting domain-containing protein [Chitinophagales bacterium]|nr:T9SS type A sorting domain-containing protein [Chitinophagales bacterium]